MRELEIQLEEERSQRSQAMLTKKQLEAELQDSEAQVETSSRSKEEAVKHLRKLQVASAGASPSPHRCQDARGAKHLGGFVSESTQGGAPRAG